jgi:hypothetical protein
VARYSKPNGFSYPKLGFTATVLRAADADHYTIFASEILSGFYLYRVYLFVSSLLDPSYNSQSA